MVYRGYGQPPLPYGHVAGPRTTEGYGAKESLATSGWQIINRPAVPVVVGPDVGPSGFSAGVRAP